MSAYGKPSHTELYQRPYPLEEFDSLTEGILMGSGIGEALAELASVLTLKGQIPPNGAVIARITELSPASTHGMPM